MVWSNLNIIQLTKFIHLMLYYIILLILRLNFTVLQLEIKDKNFNVPYNTPHDSI